MPRSLLDDPSFASIGRARSARRPKDKRERAKLALAVALLILAAGFFAWHASRDRAPTVMELNDEDRKQIAIAREEADRMSREPGVEIRGD